MSPGLGAFAVGFITAFLVPSPYDWPIAIGLGLAAGAIIWLIRRRLMERIPPH